MLIRVPLILVVLALMLSAPAQARTWVIQPDGGGDAPTVQAGIDSSQTGDTVLLESGTYVGNGNRDLRFNGKAITVTSRSGHEMTIIDCQVASVRGVTFASNETAASILSEITIRGGIETKGGGIRIVDAAPTIRDVHVTACQAVTHGAGISIEGRSTPLIAECQITSCNVSGSQTALGGGIYVEGSSGNEPEIEDCRIENNRAIDGAGIYVGDFSARPIITNSWIASNTAVEKGGGLRVGTMLRCTLTGNVIYDNTATDGGGIYFDQTTGSQTHTVENNTIVENQVTGNGSGVVFEICSFDFKNSIVAFNKGAPGIWCNGENHVVSCSITFGNNGSDDICSAGGENGVDNQITDPRFCGSPGSGYFYLRSNSPAAPDNSVCNTQVGALPVACDETPVEAVTWGSIKTRF